MSDTQPLSQYQYPLGLFDRYGVELEYMIVDRDTLNVRPICDELLKAVCGSYESEIQPDGEDSPIAWSNELALHVVEFKTNDPAESLNGLDGLLHQHIKRANTLLETMDAVLMPTAMHPWMDPFAELKLWPHEASPIYEAFDRIFSCKGHGWANLQSTHINLPFANDDEFGRLHAAIRAVLPLIPALAAASPIVDGKVTGHSDTRIDVYRTNARKLPSVSGKVIPEPVYTRDTYENELLAGLYRDIAPFDQQGILQYEWLNARGCIARFDRGSIEIRLLDIQECPKADLAITALIVETVRALTEGRWIDQHTLRVLDMQTLADVLTGTTRDAERTVIQYKPLLHALGCHQDKITAGELWEYLIDELVPHNSPWLETLEAISTHGTLSTRILKATGAQPEQGSIAQTYRNLIDCLKNNRLFLP